jgi:hypothetical protein
MTPPFHCDTSGRPALPHRARMHCPLCETRAKMIIVAWPEPASAICPRCGYEWEV